MSTAPKVSSSGLVVYAILHHVALALALIAFVMAQVDWRNPILWLVLGWLFTIPVAVFSSLILYRGWQSVQDGSAQTTPGKAVGFCFIPFFGFYWLFIAYYGLIKEFNRLARSQGRKELNEGLALTYCIISASVCLWILAMPFQVIFIWQTIGAVQELERS